MYSRLNYEFNPMLSADLNSFFVVVPLADQPPQPPYGYDDRRHTVVKVNAASGAVLWNITIGNFVPGNGDSGKLLRPIVHPSGDLIFWQQTSGGFVFEKRLGCVSLVSVIIIIFFSFVEDWHFVRMDGVSGKTVFNITGSKGFNFTTGDEITYIPDDDSVWTNADHNAGIVKLSARDGSLLFHFAAPILGGAGFPSVPNYDSRTKYLHIGLLGVNMNKLFFF
jgi:hypothetical protein